MSDTQHIHPHAIPQAGYSPIAPAATLACEELSVSVRLPSFTAHTNSGPDRKRHLSVSVPPTTPSRAGDAPLSLKRVPRLSETRPASSTVKPAGRPVLLEGGAHG